MKDSDSHDEVDGSINIFSSKDVNKQSFDNPAGKWQLTTLSFFPLLTLPFLGMNIDYIGLPPDQTISSLNESLTKSATIPEQLDQQTSIQSSL